MIRFLYICLISNFKNGYTSHGERYYGLSILLVEYDTFGGYIAIKSNDKSF